MEGRYIRMSFKAAWDYKLEFSVGSLQRCIELQMNSKLNSRKAKDFMGFETVKKGNTLADNQSKSHLKKIQQGCFELGKGNPFFLESYECQH